MSVGYEEGETCGRDGCAGVICIRDPENCYCHLSAPCSACATPREYCPECGWHLVDEETHFNGYLVGPVKANGAWTHYRPRPLDPTKIDWHYKRHSNSSMVKEGVYPEGTTRSEVEAVVKGTFGGRFEQFGGGRFRYVAYTD